MVARRWMSAWFLIILALAGFTLRAMDEKFETFRAGTQVFSNATVLNKTRTDIFVQHDGGMSNVKVRDVDPDILRALGYELPGDRVSTAKRIQTQIMTNVTQKLDESPQLKSLEERWQTDLQPKLPPITKGLIVGLLGALFVGYLFFCYCCRRIVKKTGHRAGLLIWLPGVKMIPLFQAAGMSAWWYFFVWVLPGIVSRVAFHDLSPGSGQAWVLFVSFQVAYLLAILVSFVIWAFKIVSALGKPPIWAVLLLLPLTNVIAFLYLAFSDSTGASASAGSSDSGPSESDDRVSVRLAA